MKIAVLAWGSLVWDRRELAIVNDFKPNGPQVPIEFCRVSGGGRLTLVIDEALRHVLLYLYRRKRHWRSRCGHREPPPP